MSRTPLERVRMLLSRAFMAVVFITILLSSSAWERSPVGGVFLALACILVGVGVVGRVWCALYIAGYKTISLIVTGPYSSCRNPLYLFSLFGAVGVALSTETLSAPALLLLAFATYYPLIIRKEEARLLHFHGERFEEYRQETPSFIPLWRAPKEDETYTVNAVLFRRQIVDAVWFVWLLGLTGFIRHFHAIGLIPSLFRLY